MVLRSKRPLCIYCGINPAQLTHELPFHCSLRCAAEDVGLYLKEIDIEWCDGCRNWIFAPCPHKPDKVITDKLPPFRPVIAPPAPAPKCNLTPAARERGHNAQKNQSIKDNWDIIPLIFELTGSVNTIAERMNNMGLRTRNNKFWTGTQVARLMERVDDRVRNCWLFWVVEVSDDGVTWHEFQRGFPNHWEAERASYRQDGRQYRVAIYNT